jgi:hypothetical protein
VPKWQRNDGHRESQSRVGRGSKGAANRAGVEVSGDLVALTVFKTAVGLYKVSGGFDSHPPPPTGFMTKRIPQPPVNRALRDLERHEFWVGFIVVLVGLVLLLCGARHLTGVDTTEGGTASETQLVKAFASSGLQYASKLPPSLPPKLDDPVAQAEAFKRWQIEQDNPKKLSWAVRVDTEAKAACPT